MPSSQTLAFRNTLESWIFMGLRQTSESLLEGAAHARELATDILGLYDSKRFETWDDIMQFNSAQALQKVQPLAFGLMPEQNTRNTQLKDETNCFKYFLRAYNRHTRGRKYTAFINQGGDRAYEISMFGAISNLLAQTCEKGQRIYIRLCTTYTRRQWLYELAMRCVNDPTPHELAVTMSLLNWHIKSGRWAMCPHIKAAFESMDNYREPRMVATPAAMPIREAKIPRRVEKRLKIDKIKDLYHHNLAGTGFATRKNKEKDFNEMRTIASLFKKKEELIPYLCARFMNYSGVEIAEMIKDEYLWQKDGYAKRALILQKYERTHIFELMDTVKQMAKDNPSLFKKDFMFVSTPISSYRKNYDRYVVDLARPHRISRQVRYWVVYSKLRRDKHRSRYAFIQPKSMNI